MNNWLQQQGMIHEELESEQHRMLREILDVLATTPVPHHRLTWWEAKDKIMNRLREHAKKRYNCNLY